MMSQIIAAALLTLPQVLPGYADTGYRSVAGDGHVTYSDQPRNEAARVERLELSNPGNVGNPEQLSSRHQS